MATSRPLFIPDPIETPEDMIRDRIASRSQRMDQRYPAALDLEAKLVASMHSELHGVAALTSGTHCAEHWREALRGLRPIQVGDLCRLATEPGAEGHNAVAAAAEALANAVGRTTQPIAGTPRRGIAIEAAEAGAALSGLVVSITSALEDGDMSPGELQACMDVQRRCETELADVKALLLRAGKR